MSDVALLVVSIGAGMGVYALCRMPSWLLMPINRSSLWRIRDAAFDSRRRGELPDDEATERLIREVETLILGLPILTPATMWVIGREGATSGTFRSTMELLDLSTHGPLWDLKCDAERVLMRQFLTGSWSALFSNATRHRDLLPLIWTRKWEGFVEFRRQLAADPAESDIAAQIAAMAPLLQRIVDEEGDGDHDGRLVASAS